MDRRDTILIIDDNEEILFVIADGFSEYYDTVCVTSAGEALRVLQDRYISLVICDVMMPVMDGMQFCDRLKSDIEFSHIPIILLTAKNTLQAKIEGLSIGADVYAEKPFSMEFLLAQVRSLLLNRNRVKTHFVQSPTAHLVNIANSDADKTFLETLEKHIVCNMVNSDLDVELLAKLMNMSKASLYRKINSISDLSPNEMINLSRLKRAVELFGQKERSLTEVAYEVGYNSVTQLGRNFQKHFHTTPKEFIKKNLQSKK
ncbi:MULTISPECIES: response regulator [Chitinophagaceae]